jgi:winged helix DNA-binding protein
LLELDAPTPDARRPPARLLPAFDPYLLGWKDRAYAVPEQHMGDVRLGGMIRAVASVGGTAVGTWATEGAGRGRRVEVEWWHDVSTRDRAALEREGEDVLRFEAPEPAGRAQ